MTTVVFIPGLLSDDRVWRPIAQRVNKPIAMADITRHNTISGMAKQLLAEHTGDLILIAHSMGARVAIDMARQSPLRVKAMLLSNTGHVSARPAEVTKRQAMIDLGHRDIHELAARWLPPMLAPNRISDTGLMQTLTEMVVNVGADVHAMQINALLTRPDAALTLRKLKCPVLFCTGTEDTWSPVRQHEEMAFMTPNSTLEVIDGAGHFLPIEKPSDLTPLIKTWLDTL